jgi:small redox-active disulfide protein 2
MKIEILGPGCARCRTLATNARTAAEELGLECEIAKVNDINEIASRGVLMTPALALDGAVKMMGRVARVKEIRELLAEVALKEQ